MANRVEVDLQILGNDDLNRLVSALNTFTKGITTAEGSRLGGGAPVATGDQENSSKEARNEREQSFWTRARDRAATVQVAGGTVGSYAQSISDSRAARVAGIAGSIATSPYRAFRAVEMPLAWAPQTFAGAMQAINVVGNTATGGAFTSQGGNLGMSAGGGITSDAFRFGIMNQVQNIGGWLHNPLNVSLGDISGFQSTLQDMGWNTQTGAGRSMYNLNQQYNATTRLLPMDMRAQLFDSTRYGAANVRGVSKDIADMSAAARAANLSLTQFGASTQAVMDQMAQQYGTPVTASANAAKAAAMATGLSPVNALSGVNDMTTRMALAQAAASGSAHPYTSTYGTTGGLLSAQAASYDQAARSAGYANMNAARAALKTQGQAAVLENLYRGYENARQMWPANITPQMYMTMLRRGTDDTSMSAMSSFEMGFTGIDQNSGVSQGKFNTMTQQAIAGFGGGPAATKMVQDAIARSHGNRMAALRDIHQRLTKAGTEQANQTALGHVNITLQGAAARIFNITPADTNTGNKSSVARAGTASIPINAPVGTPEWNARYGGASLIQDPSGG